MIDLTVLPGFIAMTLLFLAPPGPDMAYMLAVGLQGGRKAALKAILGIGTGMSIYSVAVALGLGTITKSHPVVLDGVRIAGAVYLLWLAYVTMRSVRRTSSGDTDLVGTRWYWRGSLVSLTNPKILLFYFAVLPQFLGDATHVGLQMAILGAANVLTEVLLYGGLGVLAGVLSARFNSVRNSGFLLNALACGVYVVLAVVVISDTLLS